MFVAVSAYHPAIDLLEALELPTNYSRYMGVSLAQGMESHETAFRLGKWLLAQMCRSKKMFIQNNFYLDGPQRNLSTPTKTVNKAIDLIKRSPDFTFSTTVRQENRNLGTIISFSSGNNR